MKPERNNIHKDLRRKALICMGALMLFYSGLVGRVTYLNYTKHDRAIKTAERVLSGSRSLYVERASILDTKGRALAVSAKEFGCAVDPQFAENMEIVIHSLKGVLGLSVEEMKRIKRQSSRKGCRFVWIRRSLTDTEYELIKKLNLSGVTFVQGWNRYYPQKNTACHLIGFTNIDGEGLEGIEADYDKVLQSENGKQLVLRDARRRIFMLKDDQPETPQRGYDLKTTIDLYIQNVVENEIEKVNSEYKPQKVIGIVMEPYTGEILALANYPSYDLNHAGESEAACRLNSAVATVYEPGSIFKPFVMSAALDAGVVKTDTPIFCENGEWRLKYRTLHDAHGYGSLSAEYVVVKSSNIGISKIAQKLGKVNLYKYLHDFGFGRKTGSGIIGEVDGVLRPYKEWSDHFSMTSIPMGQELSATSLQLITAFSAVVNGGIVVQPKLINAMSNPDSGYEDVVSPIPLRKAIAKDTSYKMREVLRKVVTHGTGRRARSKMYAIGGKTGTAQIAGVGGYQEGKYVGSFVGFAPVDSPKIVVLFSVFEPEGAYYGGLVSAPSVKEIIEKTLLYMKIPPETKKTLVMR